MPKHISTPSELSSAPFKTGRPALAYDATKLSENVRWLLNWVGQKQIFSFTGPGPIRRDVLRADSPYIHLNPDYDFTGNAYFKVITRSEALDGASHQLGGIVIPWRYSEQAGIAWTPSGGALSTLWRTGTDSHRDIDSVKFSHYPNIRINLYDNLLDPGVEGGGFAAHKLAYEKMMVAGVGIWTMPDRSLDEEWRLFDLTQFQINRQVRGYVSGGRRGLGTLIEKLEDILYRTSRCLLQSGHPTGVSTSSATYVNLRYDDAPFMVQPVAPYRGNNVPCSPAIVAGAVGASELNPVYVKFESLVAGDSYEFEITDDTEALYSAAGVLDCYRTKEMVRISIKANSDAAVYVRTFSLWEDLGAV